MTPPREDHGREPESGLGTGLISPVEAPRASSGSPPDAVQPALPGRGSLSAASHWARFWSKASVGTGCWTWAAGRSKSGYGLFWLSGRQIYAHRLSWEFTHGQPIPDGMLVCHRCDNPPCLNPEHLFIGTDADNSADKYAKGRGRIDALPRGEAHHSAKLTAATVRLIRGQLNAGLGVRTVARMLGLSRHCVRLVARGVTWRHVPDDFAQNPSTDWRAW